MKEYYKYTVSEMCQHAKIPIQIHPDNETIFKNIAVQMANTIKQNNEMGEPTVMICPVGPVGQYPYLIEMINQEEIDLKQTWFINMDEYLVDGDECIPENSSLSFRGFMQKNIYDLIDPTLIMPIEQRVFPNPKEIDFIPNLIEKLGKVDLAVGGVGINGHIAFNEPDTTKTAEEFLQLKTRVLDISPETRTANTIGDLQGALEEMPTRCVTIGMYEVYQARKIVLGCFREWHKGVLRRAVCGEVSSSFPVTLLQNHPNIQLLITDFVAEMGS